MAKVIVTFLGTGGYTGIKNKSKGEYKKATYKIDDQEYEDNFISTVLLKHFDADKVICIGTLRSMWDVLYDTPEIVSNPNDEDWERLYNKIHEKWDHKSEMTEAELIFETFSNSICFPIVLKYGLDKEENEYNINELFQIKSLLSEGDELFIDISHGFRSLPIVLLKVINFIVDYVFKTVKVKMISYGMLEVSHEMNGITPIVNLDIISQLDDTIKASHEFVEYGYAYQFSKIIPEHKDIWTNYSDVLSLNNLKKLKGVIQRVSGIDSTNYSMLQKQIVPIVIEHFRKDFTDRMSEYDRQIKYAELYMHQKKYGFSYISLKESIVTKLCENVNVDPFERNNREAAKATLLHNAKMFRHKINDIVKINHGNVDDLSRFKYADADIRQLSSDITNIRNAVAHQSYSKTSTHKMVEKLPGYIKDVRDYFNS